MTGTSDWQRVLLFMMIIFISLMAHELGHAFAVRRFGGWPMIEFYAFGGATYYQNQFDRKERLIISAAGPAFSITLALLAWITLHVLPPTQPFFQAIAAITLWINVVWTIFNLLPIQPMDGGQILRDLLGPRHYRLTCIIGMMAAIGVGIILFREKWYFAAILLGFMAFQNYKAASQ